MPNLKTSQETLRSPIDGTELVRLATPGANWQTSLLAIGRLKLSANTTYFVDTVAGNDSNNGLTAGAAFKTIQGAVNYLATNVDGGWHDVTLSLAAGTYSIGAAGTLVHLRPVVGINNLIVTSTSGVPSDVVLDITSGKSAFSAFDAGTTCSVLVAFVTLNCSDASNASYADIETSARIQFQNCVINAVGSGGVMFFSSGMGAFVAVNTCTITGGGGFFMAASELGELTSFSNTFTGTPAFGTALLAADNHAYIIAGSITGAGTGPRYQVKTHSRISVWQGDLLSQPGNSIGTIDQSSTVSYLGADGLIHKYESFNQSLFANLPADPYVGQEALITNSNTQTWGATIAGGGAFTVWGKWNGTNWTVVAL